MRIKNILSLLCISIITLLNVANSQIAAIASSSNAENSQTTSVIRFSGPFQNTSLGIGGTVIIDMKISPTTVSGYINFTNDPDVGTLCGAGSFSGTRTGDNFQFTFTSNDSDPGCSIVYGTKFNVSGTLLKGDITNGKFSHATTGQGGTFTAKRTVRYTGTFSTNGNPGTVTIDLATNSSSLVTGYMNFTNKAGTPALCGAGSFRGSVNSIGVMNYDFLSNDPDSGCGFDDGLEFTITATLSSGLSITNGSYIVSTGQKGTFTTACLSGGTTTKTDTLSKAADMCKADTELPTGKIIWPYDTYLDPQNKNLPKYGPAAKVRLEAIASDNYAVKRVEFWVKYDGKWYLAGEEYFPPYEVDFTIPTGLKSQVISVGIHVVDIFGNVAIDPEGKPTGLRYINYQMSYNNPDVSENWIPAGNRGYVNQRALPDALGITGDYQCGAASTAMILGMFNRISGSQQSLSSTANNAFIFAGEGNPVFELIKFIENKNNYTVNKDSGLEANWKKPTKEDGWALIKKEIDAGRPLIMLSSRVSLSAHYFVIVGYRIDKSVKQVIAYDPFGKWSPLQYSPYNYNKNSKTEPDSRKGQWVTYDFNSVWGYNGSITIGRLMTIKSKTTSSTTSVSSLKSTISPSSPPDIISDEPEDFGDFDGIPPVDEDFYEISGNSGMADATLTYSIDEVPYSATADENGDYTILVKTGWTGTIAPSMPGYIFIPVGKEYIDVNSNLTHEDYLAIRQDEIGVIVGGFDQGKYHLSPGQKQDILYANLNNGPVQVMSPENVIGSIRVLYKGVSYSEMLGFPSEELTNEHWFPVYDSVSLNSQIRVGNLGDKATTITVYLGDGQVLDTFSLDVAEAIRKNYAGENSGPLRIVSSDTNILASVRLLYGDSYAEKLGFPADQLTNDYWFPWYNNTAFPSELRVANTGDVEANITVYIGDNVVLDTFSLGVGESIRKAYPGTNNGPLRVMSSTSTVLPSIRVLYKGISYSEMLGLPNSKLTNEYWLPAYDSATVNSQLRFGNVGGVDTVVTVYIADGQVLETFALDAGEAIRKNYAGVNNGPLHIVSSASDILVTNRILMTTTGFESYYELLAYPDASLASELWFPWYNNMAFPSQLRIAVP